MPDVATLGRAVKAKYPGAYNDLSDEAVGRAFKRKYPGAYDDFTDTPAAQPAEAPGFFEGLRRGISDSQPLQNIKTGLQRGAAGIGEYALALSDLATGMRRGDPRPMAEISERVARTVASTMGEGAGGAEIGEELRRPTGLAEAQQRSETRRLTESPVKEGFQGVKKMRESADVRAARDPSLVGKIIRRGTEFGTLATPAVATGIATGGSVPALSALAVLQSAGQPETLPLNVALEAAPIPVGRIFKEGINTVRRTFGKGAAQIIEAEVAPAVAPRIAPQFLQEGIPPAPVVDPLQSTFAKLGTDNIEQIGAMFANANRRLNKKITPEQRASAVADYKALQQLTREEHDALSQVLPGRQFHPAEREIMDIPASERNAQLDANLREAEEFFGAEGRALQAAEDAAILGDIGPGATSGGMMAQPARVSAADLLTAPPPLSADMSLSSPALSARAAAAGVTGPRVGADLELRAGAGDAGKPPEPPFFSPDEPFPGWRGSPEERALFATPPVEGVTSGFAGQAPRGQQQLFDAAARSPWQDTALAYFRANVLTNPVGRALDLGSTIVNQFADAAVRPVAAAVDIIVSKLTGKRSITGLSVQGLRETGRAFGSLKQGARDAGEVFRTGRQVIDSGADDVLYGREIRSGVGGAVDVPVNGLFRLLGAMDAPFRRFAFTRNLSDRARVAAINEAKRGRIPKDQTVARARELMDRDDIINAAVRDGERAVLSESNVISSWLTAQTRNSPNARLALGVLQPFVRIPLNAVAKAADFAGVGGVKALYKIARGLNRKRKGGAFFRDLEDQRVFAQNVAAGSFGVAGFMLGMELEDQGKLEGYFYTGRRDFPGRRSPTSIDIGGTRYDIGRLGGFIFAPLFVGATYNRLRKEDVGKANALLRSFGGLIQQAPALGYHGAPAKAGRILSSGEPTEEALKEAGGIASGFIPASGALGATAKAFDPVKKRQAEGFTGPIMNKIPGLREQLPATGLDAIDAAVERNSPLLVELQRLGVRIAELQPKKDESPDSFNARVQQFAQNYTEYALRLIQDSRFRAAPDDVKARALKRLNEKAKGLTRKEFPFPELELDPELILDSVEK